MKKSRFTDSQIAEALKRVEAGLAVLTCPGIFGPRVFRDNGSLNLRSSDEASEVYGREDRSDIAGGG